MRKLWEQNVGLIKDEDYEFVVSVTCTSYKSHLKEGKRTLKIRKNEGTSSFTCY